MLLLNASKYGREKCDYLSGKISLTPLEKMCHVYLDNDEDPAQFVSLYEAFLLAMSDVSVRKSLVGLEYDHRYSSQDYKRLKDNSDRLSSELTRFILETRENWTNAAFEYLIF